MVGMLLTAVHGKSQGGIEQCKPFMHGSVGSNLKWIGPSIEHFAMIEILTIFTVNAVEVVKTYAGIAIP